MRFIASSGRRGSPELNTGTHDAKGFTLVEVLLAILLVSIGLIAVVPLFVQASHENSAGGDLGWLAAIAEERMELLRAEPWGGLTVGGSLTSNVAGYFDVPQQDTVVRWTVADNVTPPNTKTISLVALETASDLGPSREISLVSMRGE